VRRGGAPEPERGHARLAAAHANDARAQSSRNPLWLAQAAERWLEGDRCNHIHPEAVVLEREGCDLGLM
jgi:hypothetical protein